MNWADIKQWDSAPLQEYALECERKQRKLQETGEDLSTELSRLSGQGQTADAARNALRKRVSEIEEQVNYLISAAEVASAGVQGINEIRANIEDVQELAKAWNIQVDSSGEASLGAAEVERLFKSGHSLSAIKKYVDDVQARINSVLTQAQKLVDSLSQKIYALHAGAYDNGVHYSAKVKFAPTLPPAGASAQEVASWWSSLSDKDKQWMIENYPEQIGNLDGVDFTSRDKANRIALPQKIAEAEQQLADYERARGRSNGRTAGRVETASPATSGAPRYWTHSQKRRGRWYPPLPPRHGHVGAQRPRGCLSEQPGHGRPRGRHRPGHDHERGRFT